MTPDQIAKAQRRAREWKPTTTFPMIRIAIAAAAFEAIAATLPLGYIERREAHGREIQVADRRRWRARC